MMGRMPGKARARSQSRTTAKVRTPAGLDERSLTVVAYDIRDDGRRAKVANCLLSYGGRIEASVYELWLAPKQLERMWGAVLKLVRDGDLVRCYTICGSCQTKIRSHGIAAPNEPVAFVL
jgi:CRISPR-associated endonuclease Cas2